MVVWERNIPRDRKNNVVSPGNFIRWREMQQSFDDLSAIGMTLKLTLTGLGAVLGKMKPGVSVEAAQADMTRVHTELTRMFPQFNTGLDGRRGAAPAAADGRCGPALFLLSGAVGLVLLIACANVANPAAGRERPHAGYLPGRRATRVDRVIALRAE